MTSPYGGRTYPTSFDPNKARESRIQPTMTIKDIYPLVMMEHPEDLETASAGWRAVEKQLLTTGAELAKCYNSLESRWTGGAALVFYAWVDRTRSSLAEWQLPANANAAALDTLASNIWHLQGHMIKLWEEFTTAIAAAQAQEEANSSPGEWLWRDLNDAVNGQTRLDPVLEEYTNKTLSEVIEPLNEAYRDAFAALSPGTVFTGPLNALRPTPQQLALAIFGAPPAGLGALPSGLGTLPPGLLGVPPPIPVIPPPALPEPLPSLDASAPLPADVSALAAAVPPIPLRAGLMEQAPPAPLSVMPSLAGVFAPPGLGPRAVLPEGLGPRGVLPQGVSPAGLSGPGPPSSLVRPGAPEFPAGLRGRALNGAPGGFGAPPLGPGARGLPPQLPGRGRAPGEPPQAVRPARPGASAFEPPPALGRGVPPLSGRNARAASTSPGVPGDDLAAGPGRLGMPANLQGIRAAPARVRPGVTPPEEQPQATTMSGRLGAVPELAAEAELEPTRQAMGQGMTGRGAARPPGASEARDSARTGTRAAEAGGDPAKAAEHVDFIGDSELFVADGSAPPVIERLPEPAAVTREAPSLRPVPEAQPTAGQLAGQT